MWAGFDVAGLIVAGGVEFEFSEEFAGSGRTRKPPQLIAGLIPSAAGITDPEMQQALTERDYLIEQRAAAVLDRGLAEREPWTQALGPEPADVRTAQRWRRLARVVAAYRDRYQITTGQPLGAGASTDVQQVDAARARVAIQRAKLLTGPAPDVDLQPAVERDARTL